MAHEQDREPSPWQALVDEVVYWDEDETEAPDTTSAGTAVQSAANQLMELWIYDEGEGAAPAPVHAVIESRKLSAEQKMCLLRLLALQAIEQALPFEISLRLAFSNRWYGLTWSRMARHLGRPRQSLHRKYSALVHEITPTLTDVDAVADLASRYLRAKGVS